MKTCTKCLASKPVNAFYAHPRMGDGRLSRCKECVKARVRAHAKENQDIVRARERARYLRRRDASLAASLQRKADFPGKYRARRAVVLAVQSGALVRQPCVDCGEPRTDAHHPDYRRPLHVIWLCRRCHAKVHAQSKK